MVIFVTKNMAPSFGAINQLPPTDRLSESLSPTVPKPKSGLIGEGKDAPFLWGDRPLSTKPITKLSAQKTGPKSKSSPIAPEKMAPFFGAIGQLVPSQPLRRSASQYRTGKNAPSCEAITQPAPNRSPAEEGQASCCCTVWGFPQD
jgi:hypothetical protein